MGKSSSTHGTLLTSTPESPGGEGRANAPTSTSSRTRHLAPFSSFAFGPAAEDPSDRGPRRASTSPAFWGEAASIVDPGMRHPCRKRTTRERNPITVKAASVVDEASSQAPVGRSPCPHPRSDRFCARPHGDAAHVPIRWWVLEVVARPPRPPPRSLKGMTAGQPWSNGFERWTSRRSAFLRSWPPFHNFVLVLGIEIFRKPTKMPSSPRQILSVWPKFCRRSASVA